MSGLKLISSNGSQKFVVQVKVKGREYIVTRLKSKLALLPKIKNSVEGMFLAFDTPELAQQFLDEVRAKAPAEFVEAWFNEPEIVSITPVQ